MIRCMTIGLDSLRRHAIARTLFTPTTLPRAIASLGFVQADPIRAPARAQDLTLRQRVRDYRAGDLERRYPQLEIEEDFFVNYGFLPRELQALMHPRRARRAWSKKRAAQAAAVLEFVRERGAAHPREVDAHFNHGKVRNWFGGSGNASTHLLDDMHYRGLLRVARRDGGTRVYAAREPWPEVEGRAAMRERMDALVDLIVAKYSPLPASSLVQLVRFLRSAAPQWAGDRARALKAAKERLAHARIDGVDWYWHADEDPRSRRHAVDDRVRLLAPFDPIVWDRRRFELLWGWAYRFEAYTPAPKRKLGYYALPLLWRDQVPGWANAELREGTLSVRTGYAAGHAPRERSFAAALRDEVEAMARFLGAQRTEIHR
jgi:uncharacterized protein YcaQ